MCTRFTKGLCLWASRDVVSFLSAHRWRTRQSLGWAAGGRQVHGKINAICKVPSTQFQGWIVSSKETGGYIAKQRIKVMTQLNFGKIRAFLTSLSEMTLSNRKKIKLCCPHLLPAMEACSNKYISTCCTGHLSGHSGTAQPKLSVCLNCKLLPLSCFAEGLNLSKI